MEETKREDQIDLPVHLTLLLQCTKKIGLRSLFPPTLSTVIAVRNGIFIPSPFAHQQSGSGMRGRVKSVMHF